MNITTEGIMKLKQRLEFKKPVGKKISKPQQK